MMDGMKKVRPGQSALFLLGIIYPIVGGVFLMVGLAFWLAGTDEELTLLGMIFTGIGGLFLLLGVIFLSVELSRLRRNNRLLSAGRYVWGQIVQVVPNYNVRIRGRHPQIAMVRYRDSRGVDHIFKSESLKIYPDPAIVGKQVKVFISDDTCRRYYVDMDGVLPHGVEY